METPSANFSSLEGVLYDSDKSQLVRVPMGANSYVMPNSVLSYRSSAFAGNTALSEITFGCKLPRQEVSLKLEFLGC